ncbi:MULTISPECIES: LegC family aminotransferase [Clostridium]|uniref:Aminotransferase DegT n=1 Tax=Clostridium beijerinckii TaxID=1520 RepID=A0A1S9N7F5_CLOBE|nr:MULTISPECIES: LegC family aminotransferase [Clostridium]MBN7574102.1 LegC family aminotransferase [Clostridium beijerinckii]MBN7577886.1 LegC family aminotransferase [Clostridium beijerinckii]MBN7583852.1 LegC family aminotransferase [Clostridium beijerinckii]MBO0518869.1 LegC family aminotransferase [Clostridium beijerinckii]MZK50030.1 LegC family aminotransferase [Clostridium beijerinckii]
MIPLSVPNLKGNEEKYVVDAIRSEWVSTSGNYVSKFENNIKSYLNVNNAIACQSGTAAIHLALLLSGVTNNNEVIVPTLTFIAAVNPVKYLGADPVFMDCDDSLNLDYYKLKEFLETQCIMTENGLKNKLTNKIIKAVIVVHVFGNMANIEKIIELTKKYNLKLIEDSTEALGTYYLSGKYKGKFAGTIGDFGAYSFNGNKIITTGGGGLLVSRSSEDIKKAKYLSTQAKDDELYYVHDHIGYNYRMTNLQGALGAAQLEKIEEFINIKIRNYELYKSKMSIIKGLTLLDYNNEARNNHWFYSLVINDFKLNRDQLLKYLSQNKIQTRPIWKLIHTQKPYLDNQSYKIEKANLYYNKILNIPCSTNLKKESIEYIINTLKKA